MFRSRLSAGLLITTMILGGGWLAAPSADAGYGVYRYGYRAPVTVY